VVEVKLTFESTAVGLASLHLFQLVKDGLPLKTVYRQGPSK